MTFQSQFCIAKKCPAYIDEYSGFLTSNRNVDANIASVMAETFKTNWAAYSDCGKARKKKEKNSKSSKKKETPTELLSRLRELVMERVSNETMRGQLLDQLAAIDRHLI
jgi:hypothetical protein